MTVGLILQQEMNSSGCHFSLAAAITVVIAINKFFPRDNLSAPGILVSLHLVTRWSLAPVRFKMLLSKEDKRAVIFYLCICVVFMQAGFYASRRSASPYSAPRTDSQWTLPFAKSQTVLKDHPIPQLMAEAEEHFKQMLSRQSKSLKKAVAEYKRRYGRNPPKGFDQWWDFAQKHDVKIIDDYDAVFEDLSPFWDMSGEEFRARADVVRETSPPIGLSINVTT